MMAGTREPARPGAMSLLSPLAILLSRRPALVPAGAAIPAIEASMDVPAADAHRLSAYRRLCGFAHDGTLPITWPHVVAMPLHLRMLTSEAFPIRLLGLVHLHNRIESRQPLPAARPLELSGRVHGHRETDRGQEIDVHTCVRVDGVVAWTETSTFLARRARPVRRRVAPGSEDTPGSDADRARNAPAGPGARDAGAAMLDSAAWSAPSDTGRRYARLSGDWNPIHLWTPTARPFGFRRPIAHGMWLLGCAAARLGDTANRAPATLSVSFRLPVLLPTEVRLRTRADAGGLEFAVVDARDARPHLTGRCA
jgi:acyl dehydratase